MMGTVRLNALTLGDEQFIQRLAAQSCSSRDFAEAVIAHQLETDLVTPMSSWSDALLGHVGIGWLKQLGSEYWPPARQMPLLDAFRVCLVTGLRQTLNERSGLIAEIAAQSLSMYTANLRALQPAATMLKSLQSALTFAPSFEPIINTLRQLGSLQTSLADFTRLQLPTIEPPMEGFLRRLQQDQAVWFNIQSQQGILQPIIDAFPKQDELLGMIQRSAHHLAQSFAAIDLHFQQGMDWLVAQQPLVQPCGSIFAHLPSLDRLHNEWRRLEARVADGREVLDEAGFGFTAHLWSIYFVANFAALDPRIQGAQGQPRYV